MPLLDFDFDGLLRGMGRSLGDLGFGPTSPRPVFGTNPFQQNGLGFGMRRYDPYRQRPPSALLSGRSDPFGSMGNPFARSYGDSPMNSLINWAPQSLRRPPQRTGGQGAVGRSNGPAANWGSPSLDAVERQLGARGVRNPDIRADYLAQTANKYGVPLALVLAVLNQESGYGTDDNTATRNYNYFGLIDPSQDLGLGTSRVFQKFNSPEEGIDAAIRNMGSQIYQGLTLREYLGLYLTGDPRGADDMAGNTTASYIANAEAIIRNLGGTATADSQVFGNDAAWGGTGTGGGGATGDWLGQAKSLMGIDYTNGGIRQTGNPQDGMDCSSFTGYVLGMDRNLWNAQVQYDNSTRVSDPQAGDLVFFQGTNPDDPTARPVSHVGIYIGNNQMIHTGTPGVVVEITNLGSSYWQSKLYGFGRL